MAEETRGRGEFGRGGYQKRQPQWRDRDGERSDRGERGRFRRDDRRDGDRDFQRRDNDRRDFGSRDDRRGDRGGYQRRDDRRGGFQDRGRGGAQRNDGGYKSYSSTDEYVSPTATSRRFPPASAQRSSTAMLCAL